MTWEENDLNNINMHNAHNAGQISRNNLIGDYLYKTASNPDIKNILEIGTWNGLGSTKCIVDGLKIRKTNDCAFYSLECNSEKVEMAKKHYKDIKNVFILNEVLLNNMPSDIYHVFPELKDNEMLKHWNDVDFDNMKDKPLFFNRNDLPAAFDLILLDGGEFTTWYEYLEIKDKCRILALDDTNVAKCKRIVEEIKADTSKWKIILDSNERNGTFVAERIF